MHEAIVRDSEERNAVYVPAGVAHGFQTLEDKTEIEYQMTDFYAPTLSAGLRWNDVAFGIEWPLPVAVISEQDSKCEDFNRLQFEHELRQRDVQTSNSHGVNVAE
jgi:dTDP-4-dehydrorhamnose 3,5-epimerase